MEYELKKKVHDVQFKVDTEGFIKTKVHTGILLLWGIERAMKCGYGICGILKNIFKLSIYL